MLSLYVVWGSTYLAIRFAVQTMPSFLMAAARFLAAGALLYAWRRARGDPAPTKREWQSASFIGLFLLLGGNGCVVWAERRIVSSVAALLISSTPLWMILINALRPGGQRPKFLSVLAIVMGFGGVALLIGPGQLAGGVEKIDLPGAFAAILGALLWSIGSIYSQGARLPASAMMGTSMEMLVGGAGLLALGTLTGEWGQLNLASISSASLWGLGYLIVFGSWVGFGAYTWLLRVAPLSLISTYAYVNPVVAVVMGYWLAREPLTPTTAAAAAIIVGSVALTTIANHKTR
jgi:drug/metabolite transporter (DMT)-like permease